MTSDETDPQPSLGELLGIDVLADLPDLPEQVWEHALDIATDPRTPPVDPMLIPAGETEDIELRPQFDTDPAGGIDAAEIDSHEDSYADEGEWPTPSDDLDDPTLGL